MSKQPLSAANAAVVMYSKTTGEMTRDLPIPEGKTWEEIMEYVAKYLGTNERVGDTVVYS